jgi:hypothetical protein
MDDDGIQMRGWYTAHGDVYRFRPLAVEVKPYSCMSDIYEHI